jgi:hypothetical protein
LSPFISECFVFPFLSTNLNVKIHRTIISPVSYRCETWSLTLREEHRFRVAEKRILRRIFGPRRGESAEGWRRLDNKELHNLRASPIIIRMNKSRRMK